MIQTSVELDAVLCSLRMAADAIAALAPGDRLEVASNGGAGLLVELVAHGETVATASLDASDGRLTATIIRLGPGRAGRRIEQWKLRKAATRE